MTAKNFILIDQKCNNSPELNYNGKIAIFFHSTGTKLCSWEDRQEDGKSAA